MSKKAVSKTSNWFSASPRGGDEVERERFGGGGRRKGFPKVLMV